jgi:hypothetical protein
MKLRVAALLRSARSFFHWSALRRCAATLSLFALLGCNKEQMKTVPDLSSEFSGSNAFCHVEALVAIGQRYAGSPGIEKARRYIEAELTKAGLEVEFQVFEDDTPKGKTKFVNLIAYPRVRGSERIILGSHYDSVWIDKVNFVGANDSGSSTGVLLELARVLAPHAMRPTPYFVFFDGEEPLGPWSSSNGLYGSRYLVRSWKQRGELAQVRAMILSDMVGDKHLNVGIPPHSTPALAKAIFEASAELGYRNHFSYMNSDMSDDHLPFLMAGIPSIDLIDYEFGSAPGLNDYWHTDKDTLDKISSRSLEVVGQTILKALPKITAPREKRK